MNFAPNQSFTLTVPHCQPLCAENSCLSVVATKRPKPLKVTGWVHSKYVTVNMFIEMNTIGMY